MTRIASYEQLEAAAKKLAVHRVLKDLIRIRPALERDGTLLDSPAVSQNPPGDQVTASPCALPAAGESTFSATGVDVRRMAANFAIIDAIVLVLMVGYALGKHL
jgi:hypothetical protein